MQRESLGYACWLQEGRLAQYEQAEWTKEIVVAGSQAMLQHGPLRTAIDEIKHGITVFAGQEPVIHDIPARNPYMVLGVQGSSNKIHKILNAINQEDMPSEGYLIKSIQASADEPCIVLAGKSASSMLYAAFHFLRLLRLDHDVCELNIKESPAHRLRMINHWDNMDGSVERGYAGKSIFFHDNQVLSDSPRLRDYARLLASIGINAITINNVNVHHEETMLITQRWLPEMARIAELFHAYGIQLFLSVNYASPIELRELTTADPLDSDVAAWWKRKAAEIYEAIPQFGGFLVKADSENRPGPFTYGRNHADGANMLAEALEPYGGLILWRCFVYDCHQDWRDRKTDRARAAYDHFKPLDGCFKDNVILQIKNGPMDFQVREPVSPLLGTMEHTNQLLEFQITQEYTGQQIHACYLVPQWKEILDFDTGSKDEGSMIKQVTSGQVHPYTHCGITAVVNVGDDDNWTGHHLAQANLYGYGRLIWNPDLSAEQIACEWARETFGNDTDAADLIACFLLESWPIYEQYNAPLGVGWMVKPHYHYGPDIDGYEYSKWGTYHFADCKGIGVDRTQATGTGYISQYTPHNAERYEHLNTCPDELLLFFHHVPYTHVLHSGKTVIQHIYDTHFEGVERLEHWITRLRILENQLDGERYTHIMKRFAQQLDSAKEWRDVINTYFYRKSGIEDEKGRVIY